MRHYDYIGSEEFLPKGGFPERLEIGAADSLNEWLNEHADELDLEGCIPATFVVDTDGRFWIAERNSEHVACARLDAVLSAGEIFSVASGPPLSFIGSPISPQATVPSRSLGRQWSMP